MPAITVGTNSYVSLADADNYHQGNIAGDDWLSLDREVRERALISATRMLDRQKWVGTKTSPVQTLEWPRTGVVDAYGNTISSVTVPSAIISATAELALTLALDPNAQNAPGTKKGIKRVKAGSAEVEYFFSSTNSRFNTIVNELIGRFLNSSVITGNASLAGGFASGTCERSKFTPGEYDISEAL